MANSPNAALKIPLPFVRTTLLAVNSGKSVCSNPADRECTHCSFGHIPNTSRNRASVPEQLQSTVALFAAAANSLAEFPVTMRAPTNLSFSRWICGASLASASTRIVSSVQFIAVPLLDGRKEFAYFRGQD